jgi:hypothetical protein
MLGEISFGKGTDDGKNTVDNAAQNVVLVKFDFHQVGGVSYGDDDDGDVASANEDNINLYS